MKNNNPPNVIQQIIAVIFGLIFLLGIPLGYILTFTLVPSSRDFSSFDNARWFIFIAVECIIGGILGFVFCRAGFLLLKAVITNKWEADNDISKR